MGPFHEGEQRIQERLGVREEIEPWARRVVRPELPEQHRAFYAQLPFVVLAARDSVGRPWATLLAGTPGFLSSPDAGALRVTALPAPGDALCDALQPQDDVGLLGIELHTRRRNRVNGRVAQRTPESFLLSVTQGFGNCPQYITERHWQRVDRTAASVRAERGSSLARRDEALIGRADTFFIATGFRAEGESETYGMDASHRGGAAGFVSIESATELVFPDYAGNNHFNTLGNLLMDPRAGLLFADLERGDLLQLTGRAQIDWESERIDEFPGARRLVRFEIEEIVWREGALPLRFEASGGVVRELRVLEKRVESEEVTSFVLAARDGGALAGFTPGQHLPIELEIPDQPEPVRRTYSLSGAAGEPHYRISVKRDPMGAASRHLHDRVQVGDFVRASAPQGIFTLDASCQRPAVLVSAGVGVTPLVPMLHALAERCDRPVWFVHGARDGAHHPLREELERVAESAPHVELHTAYSQPRAEDRGHQSEGRVDGALLASLVPDLKADFYLCGPVRFMAAIQGELESRGVPPDHIHSESFGPAS